MSKRLTALRHSTGMPRVALCVLLVASAISEHAVYYHFRPEIGPDEARFSLPTVKFLSEHRRPLLFLYGNAYMAPALEVLSMPLAAAARITPLNAIRTLSSMCLAVSAVFVLLTINLEFTLLPSSLAAFYFALGTPWLLPWELKAPGYPFGLLVSWVFVYLVLRLHPRSFILGITSAVLYYLFPICIGFILAALVALARRHDAVAVDLEHPSRYSSHAVRQRWAYLLIFAGLAVSVFVLAYFPLTGRGSIHSAKLVCALVAVIVFGAATLQIVRERIGTRRFTHLVKTGAMFAAGFALIHVPVTLVFKFIEEPYFQQRHVELWAGNTYWWKTSSAWPNSFVALSDRLLPRAFIPIPRSADLPTYDGPLHVTWRVLITVAMFLILFLGARLIGTWRDVWRYRTECLLLTSLAAILILLLPSGRLFGDPAVRYLTPYVPAFYAALGIVISAVLGFKFKKAVD